jgi:uncharacterized protein YjbI with pentapeptide repeats
MALTNPEHLQILKQGVKVWNAWREQNEKIRPDLREVHLIGAILYAVDLHRVDFSRAHLAQASLQGANLIGAHLGEADLGRAYLYGAQLYGAHLGWTYLYEAFLHRADLRKANLGLADLTGAFLQGANLTGADLREANLTRADLTGADLSEVQLDETVFANTDLTAVRDLETCNHRGPSILDHRTLARSGSLPLAFLRGCGLPDALIEYLPSLLNEPVQFYSCFISYASKDRAIAERLHADLQNKGVRCWFAPKDMKIGDRLRPRIDETIRIYDKLLLVLSKTSVVSQWVEQEVETALARERQQGTTILFPVRIDNTVMTLETGWPALVKNTRNIGDFRRWKTHAEYQKAFDRLLRDLKAESGQPHG